MKSREEFLFEGPWENFYVKEHNKCIEVVSAMCERVQYWDKFPAVDVAFDGGKFYVIQQGNHRSISHFIIDAPLRCNLVDVIKGYYSSDMRYFPISKVCLADFDVESDDDSRRLCCALSYFSEKDAKRFCLKNDLKV